MLVFIVAWLSFGIGNWGNYLFNYAEHPSWIDLFIGLPYFLLLGPISTIKKVLQ